MCVGVGFEISSTLIDLSSKCQRVTSSITLFQNKFPNIFSNKRIVLFKLLANLGDSPLNAKMKTWINFTSFFKTSTKLSIVFCSVSILSSNPGVSIMVTFGPEINWNYLNHKATWLFKCPNTTHEILLKSNIGAKFNFLSKLGCILPFPK